MTTMTLSSKNQVVIPKEVRLKMRLKGGDELIVAKFTKDQVVLKKVPSFYDLIGTVPRLDEDPVKRIRKLREQWRSSDLP